MTSLKQAVQSGRFVVTAVLSSSDGYESQQFMQQANALRGWVTAIQIREDPLRHRQLSVLATAAILERSGIDPIPEISEGDRNRIALMSDLLGLRALGVTSLLIGGQKVSHHTTGPVAMVTLVEALNEEESVTAEEEFLIGIRTDIHSVEAEADSGTLVACANAGARFVQMQPCLDLDALRKSIGYLVENRLTWDYAVLVGVAIMTSVEKARRLLTRESGCVIPQGLIERLQSADDALSVCQ